MTPPQLVLSEFCKNLQKALEVGGALITALQIRLKNPDETSAEEAVIKEAVQAILPICQHYGVATILNDRPDWAQYWGCDGAHIGQKDMPIEKARALLGKDLMLGVTCHDSRHLAMDAAEKGADYVAFGAFYDSATKKSPHKPEPEILTFWSDIMEIPCVAIGGITAKNALPLINAGADFLCVSSAIWQHPQGVETATQEFLTVFDEARAVN